MQISVKEAAERLSVSERQVQKLCSEGAITGASKISGVWLVPSESVCIGPNSDVAAVKQLSVADVAEILSVSQATVRNWIRLDKIKPDLKKNKFSEAYINDFVKDLESNQARRLKSRRNKKHLTGRALYRSYIDDDAAVRFVSEVSSLNVVESTRDLLVLLSGVALRCYCNLCDVAYGGLDMLNETESVSDSWPVFRELAIDLLDGIVPTQEECERMAPALSKKIKYSREHDLLGFVYISFKERAARKKGGIYYTPNATTHELIDSMGLRSCLKEGGRFLDPCCGSGNFLIGLASSGFDTAQLYGCDIDKTSVHLTRINLFLCDTRASIRMLRNQITVSNFLTDPPVGNFDVILGNPPWGSELDEPTLESCRRKLETALVKKPESYDLFVNQALRLLVDGGMLGFVLPEAIMNVRSHEMVRSVIVSSCDFRFVSFIGNVFDGVQCPAILLGLKKGGNGSAVGCKVRRSKSQTYTIKMPRNLSKQAIELNTTDEEELCLRAIEGNPGNEYLRGSAKFALGIVTGDNSKYIATDMGDGREPVLRGSDIFRYRARPGSSYIEFRPEEFQQVAPVNLYRAEEKLLYRFISDVPVFAYDDRKTLSLNSANILIPEIDGLDILFVMAVLNSSVASFYFSKRFNSVKMLRQHIESIPIARPPDELQKRIVLLTKQLMRQTSENRELYRALDGLIFQMYGLDDGQRHLITEVVGKKDLVLLP